MATISHSQKTETSKEASITPASACDTFKVTAAAESTRPTATMSTSTATSPSDYPKVVATCERLLGEKPRHCVSITRAKETSVFWTVPETSLSGRYYGLLLLQELLGTFREAVANHRGIRIS